LCSRSRSNGHFHCTTIKVWLSLLHFHHVNSLGFQPNGMLCAKHYNTISQRLGLFT
jgi:hypothetical protein